jgi:hypothetical protein
MKMSTSKSTTSHKTIQSWIEARNGRPARVKTGGDGGILRVDFGKPEENLEEIAWDEFFDIFDKNELAFLYQDETQDGKPSRFSKFVSRQ